MVPAILLLTAATLFAKNVHRPIVGPTMTDGQVATLAKAMVIVLAAISLYLAVYSSTTLVSLQLLGLYGMTLVKVLKQHVACTRVMAVHDVAVSLRRRRMSEGASTTSHAYIR
jgi:Na+/proline symporter